VLWEQGDYVGALDAAQHALDIIKNLVEVESTNLLLKRSLGESYGYLGSALQRLDRLVQAREAYEAALAIRQELAKAAPDDGGLANEVAWTTDRIRQLDQIQRGSERSERKVRK
jgi:tetratricopeptide (TPR) repeat protein